MKHSTRIAALMVAASIFAFLPSAQVCGQSARRSGGGGHSSSMSSSHGGSSHSHSGSHSGSTYSRSGGSQTHSRPSSGAISGSQHRSRPSGGAISGSQNHSRPSGGAISGSQNHSRPSSGAISGSQNHSRPSSGALGGSQHHSRPSSGYSDGSYGHKRPSDVRDHAAAVPGRTDRSRPEHHGSIDGARRPGGAVNNHRPSGSVSHNRPASGTRPAPGARPAPGTRHNYSDGVYGHGRPAPGRIHVNPRPGARPVNHRPAPVALRERPHHFHNYGRHYYGYYVPAPPRGYIVRHYWGRDYYYYNDIWYRYHSGRYWVCRPPWGYVFTPLADAVYTACAFAYYYDRIHYYDTINDNARTITAQNEAIAANNAVIAAQNEQIARNSAMAQATGDLANSLGLVQSFADASVEYFYNDGVFYVKGADGQYTVIVPPAGALVESLPDDYETIELGGETYYKVDDTIYRTTIVNGKAMFEVLGQLMN